MPKTWLMHSQNKLVSTSITSAQVRKVTLWFFFLHCSHIDWPENAIWPKIPELYYWFSERRSAKQPHAFFSFVFFCLPRCNVENFNEQIICSPSTQSSTHCNFCHFKLTRRRFFFLSVLSRGRTNLWLCASVYCFHHACYWCWSASTKRTNIKKSFMKLKL